MVFTLKSHWPGWAGVGFLSLKPLTAWYKDCQGAAWFNGKSSAFTDSSLCQDLNDRIAFFNKWYEGGWLKKPGKKAKFQVTRAMDTEC